MMTDREFQEYLLKRLDSLAEGQKELAAQVAGLQTHARWWGAIGGAVIASVIGLFNTAFRRQ
jgi:hypothetical protein